MGDIADEKSTSDYCSDDAPLMAIAALTSIEGVMYKHSLLNLVHLSGLIELLKARPRHGPVSEMSKRICEHYLCDVYVAAVMRGVPSPFENLNPALYRLQDRRAGSADIKLRATGNELSVRLPRLIVLVRNTCDSSNSERSADPSDALEVVKELSKLRDDSSESTMLHTVRVINPTSEQDSKAIKFCYHYNSVSTFKAGISYWHSRATLLRLVLRLLSHGPESHEISSVQIVSELQRCVSNLIMSAPYARCLTLRASHRLFARTMLVCWGALRDSSEAMPRCARESEVLFAWLLETANRSHPVNAPLTSADMDRMAEIFAGGPLPCLNIDFAGLAKIGIP